MTPDEVLQQGLRLHQAGRLAEAAPFYEAALKATPGFSPAQHLMALLQLDQGNPAAALESFSRAIAAAPNGHPLLSKSLASRGEIFLAQERMEEALMDFEAALAADPGSAATWNNRGLALSARKRFDAALTSFDRALALSPGSIQIHNNRGDVLRQLRRYDEALASFERALTIDPADWATRNNRALLFSVMGRLEDALAEYSSALAIQPNIPQALHARGNLLWSQKAQLGPAIADLERLIELIPDFPFARGSLMRLTMTAARWDDYETQKTLLDDGVRQDRPVIEPFIYLALSEDTAALQACARLYARTRFAAQPPLCIGTTRRTGRIRIGYVCGEFRAHATLYLLAGLFEAHDKAQFEIFAFDNGGSDGSVLRARFDAAVEHIVDITRLSDAEAAACIHSHDIDILVDLNGYSGNQRLGIFAHRPAPVQVSYLAYPGTLGAPYMDYILADKTVIPPGDEKFYDEKIVRLPHSYQINDDQRAIAPLPERVEAGLPEDAFVFCNFNHANKFTPATFARWMWILNQIPHSVLWLLKPDPMAMDNLKQEAAQQGVDPARLFFADILPFDRHLARLALADLFLDGLPYGAHTTASDALWAGLPLITCYGATFPGRVAASLLNAIGLPELVTQGAEAFEALALTLARDPALLNRIREKLARNRQSAPLFSTKATTSAIETAYRIMFEQRVEPPKSFDVA